MTRASDAIERYHARVKGWHRTRFTPEHDVVRQTDPKLPGVVFFRYPDGSNIRLEHGQQDPQEF